MNSRRARGRRFPPLDVASMSHVFSDSLWKCPEIAGKQREQMATYGWTDGRALVLQVHSASIQDRDGALPLLKALRRAFPFVECALPTAHMQRIGWRTRCLACCSAFRLFAKEPLSRDHAPSKNLEPQSIQFEAIAL
jgi:hypothetical protein